jgi:signal transduction histidine kinase/PAS domain-containing protein
LNCFQQSNLIETMIERISDSIFSLNLEGEIQYMNPMAINLLKVDVKEWQGKCYTTIFNGDFVGIIQEQISKSIYSQKEIYVEIQVNEFTNQWVEFNFYPSLDGITVLCRDISSKKQVEKVFQEQQEKLELLKEAANHLVYKQEPKELLDALFKELADYLDLDVYFNYIVDESEQRLKLMNYAGIPESVAKEIEWLDYGEAVCGCVALDRKRIVAENIDLSNDERVQLVKGFGIKAYACHPLMVYGKLVGTLSFGSSTRSHFSQEELDLIFTICNQVATTLDRIFLISELTKKKEEAEKANKAKSEFLSAMSHELRTPLHSIIGFAQILEGDRREPLSAEQNNKVSKMLKASRHLLTLINDILDVSRIENRRPVINLESTNMGMVLEESLKIIKPLADSKGIRILNQQNFDPNIMIIADSRRLLQVLINLLSNAVKYSHVNGEIAINFELESSQLKTVVIDNGIGIEPEEHGNIFSPFYRIFNSQMNIEGTGIGLTLVKQYIEEMQGKVGVTSKLGEGSHFWFTLPMENAKSYT